MASAMALRVLMFTHAATPDHDSWPFAFTVGDDDEVREAYMASWTKWLAEWEPSRDWLQ